MATPSCDGAHARYVAKYDATEADLYDVSVGQLSREDEDAYLSDLKHVFQFQPGMDGLYGRDGWAGQWQAEVDVLPLSACQTTALTPYLLEVAGFRIDAVQLMHATNARPCTKTPRYVVVATKPA